MEVPPGSTAPLEVLAVSLKTDLEFYLSKKRNRTIWLAMEDKEVKGLVDFFLKPPRVHIKFLCAIPPGQGTGTLILRYLANYCLSRKISTITAEVSKDDSRAWNFYFNHLGFRNQGISTEEPDLTLHQAIIQPHTLLDNLKG
ncbi:MAG: GNAT family N-acetyltransferase [Candidatus Hodarchaeota archaeon]